MFKKQWIAVLAAGLVSPAALAFETTGGVYGDFRLSLGYFDSDSSGTDTDIDNNNSHLGLRVQGAEGDLAVFAQYERLADNDDGTAAGELTRQFFAGISCPTYGTVSFGRQATAYKLSGQKLDPFYNTSVAGTSGSAGVINGASYGLSSLTNDSTGSGFVNNQIAYTSPAWFGVTINASVFLDDGAGDAENHDYGVGAEWKDGGITAGVQMLDLQSGSEPGSVQNFNNIGLGGPNGELDAARAYGAYAAERWGAGGSYERLNLRNGQPDREYLYASAWFGLSDKLRLAASYGDTYDTPFEGSAYTVGASYEVLKSLNLYAAARQVDRDESPTSTSLSGDTTSFAVGASYAFEITLN